MMEKVVTMVRRKVAMMAKKAMMAKRKAVTTVMMEKVAMMVKKKLATMTHNDWRLTFHACQILLGRGSCLQTSRKPWKMI